jgi:hypothetical protein
MNEQRMTARNSHKADQITYDIAYATTWAQRNPGTTENTDKPSIQLISQPATRILPFLRIHTHPEAIAARLVISEPRITVRHSSFKL